MRTRTKAATLYAVLMLAVFLLAGCGSKQDPLVSKMKEEITMGSYHVETDELSNVSMTATVTMPDYSKYMLVCLPEAEAAAKNEADFEKQLYTLVSKAADGAPADCTREVTIDLTALNDRKAQKDWKYEELVDAARQAAFDAEVEEFCLQLLAGEFPADLPSAETESEAAE